MPERSDTLVRDRLARQRTELANERTLLSYIRTALGFFAVGIPAVWWLGGSDFKRWVWPRWPRACCS